MYSRWIAQFLATMVVAGCAAQSRDNAISDREFWGAILRIAETDIFDRATVENLVGVPLEDDRRRQFHSPNNSATYAAVARLRPFQEVEYLLSRQSSENVARFGADKDFVEATAALTLWLNDEVCYSGSIIFMHVQDPPIPRYPDVSNSGRSVDSVLTYEIEGRIVTFGFRDLGHRYCVKFVEVSSERRAG